MNFEKFIQVELIFLGFCQGSKVLFYLSVMNVLCVIVLWEYGDQVMGEPVDFLLLVRFWSGEGIIPEVLD